MAAMIKHTAVWTGTVGLPGYSDFYQGVSDPISSSAQSGHNSVRNFFVTNSGLIPGEVSVTVDPTYQVIEATTGLITSEGTVATPSSVVVGSNGDGYSAQVGVLIEWLTGAYINGRRLRGRTYMVPFGGFAQTDGTVVEAILGDIRGTLQYIVDAGEEFVVWHRPVNGAGGSFAAITSGVVRDHACILRSRMR